MLGKGNCYFGVVACDELQIWLPKIMMAWVPKEKEDRPKRWCHGRVEISVQVSEWKGVVYHSTGCTI